MALDYEEKLNARITYLESELEAEREKVRKLVEALKEIYRLDDEGDGYRTPFQNIAMKAIKEIEEA